MQTGTVTNVNEYALQKAKLHEPPVTKVADEKAAAVKTDNKDKESVYWWKKHLS